MQKELNEAVDFLNKQGITEPLVGIVLGTGLGKLAEEISIEKSIDYRDIPHFPLSTVEFHKGKLVYGTLRGKKVLAMQGRFHFYEGYTLQQITFPIRVMKLLGIRYLLISNAAGAMNLNYKKGSLMLIEDHINFIPGNPLQGLNNEDYGPRFPDMSEPYSKFLNEKIKQIALDQMITLHKGVYVAVMGPNLETRAEYRMFRQFADAVGMSTVPEVIVANHMGLPCAAISVLTDECDPDNLKPANINHIIAIASKAEPNLITLFCQLIEKLD
jgi:purine-nucleoside phosphorylase